MTGKKKMEIPVEEKIANDIMQTVLKLNLPLVLDRLIEGKGNCFPLAIIAQCKRRSIYKNTIQVFNI